MLEEAEKYAAADKTKRETIDVKNQAETLCAEAEKELSLSNETISEETKQTIQKLIAEIKQNLQDERVESLKSLLEDLKEAMKSLMEAKDKNEMNAN
jgi:molecular chaperone DnaK